MWERKSGHDHRTTPHEAGDQRPSATPGETRQSPSPARDRGLLFSSPDARRQFEGSVPQSAVTMDPFQATIARAAAHNPNEFASLSERLSRDSSQPLRPSGIPLLSSRTHQEVTQQPHSMSNPGDSSLRAKSSQRHHVHDTSPYKRQASEIGSEGSSSMGTLIRRFEAIPSNSELEEAIREKFQQVIDKNEQVLNKALCNIDTPGFRENNQEKVQSIMDHTIALSNRLSSDAHLRIKRHKQKVERLNEEIKSLLQIIAPFEVQIDQCNREKDEIHKSNMLNPQGKARFTKEIDRKIAEHNEMIRPHEEKILRIEESKDKEQAEVTKAQNDEARQSVLRWLIQDISSQLKKSSLPPQTSEVIPQTSSNQPDAFPSRSADKAPEVPQHLEPATHSFGNQPLTGTGGVFPKVHLDRITDSTEQHAHAELLKLYAQELRTNAIQAYPDIWQHYQDSQIHYKWYRAMAQLTIVFDQKNGIISIAPNKSRLEEFGIKVNPSNTHLYQEISAQKTLQLLREGKFVQWSKPRISNPYYRKQETYNGKKCPIGVYCTDNITQLTKDVGGNPSEMDNLYKPQYTKSTSGPWSRADGVNTQPRGSYKQKHGNVDRWR
jgi:hypothetical protein